MPLPALTKLVPEAPRLAALTNPVPEAPRLAARRVHCLHHSIANSYPRRLASRRVEYIVSTTPSPTRTRGATPRGADKPLPTLRREARRVHCLRHSTANSYPRRHASRRGQNPYPRRHASRRCQNPANAATRGASSTLSPPLHRQLVPEARRVHCLRSYALIIT